MEKTKHELQETKKKLQIAEKNYDDLMKEIRNMFSFVKEKDSSDEGMTEEDDFPADNEEEDDGCKEFGITKFIYRGSPSFS